MSEGQYQETKKKWNDKLLRRKPAREALAVVLADRCRSHSGKDLFSVSNTSNTAGGDPCQEIDVRTLDPIISSVTSEKGFNESGSGTEVLNDYQLSHLRPKTFVGPEVASDDVHRGSNPCPPVMSNISGLDCGTVFSTTTYMEVATPADDKDFVDITPQNTDSDLAAVVSAGGNRRDEKDRDGDAHYTSKMNARSSKRDDVSHDSWDAGWFHESVTFINDDGNANRFNVASNFADGTSDTVSDKQGTTLANPGRLQRGGPTIEHHEERM